MEEEVYSKLNASPLPFLHLMEGLKHLPRTGWMRFIDNPESVAAHSWRLTTLGMCAPDGVDVERCMFLGHCHDMAESVVGDIPTFAGMPKERKHKLEDFGIRYIESLLKPFNPILGPKIRAAWEEYEEGTTPEAQFVRECDKLECLVQAHEYELRTNREQEGLQEFQGLISKIKSEEGKAWAALLQQERNSHFSRLKQRAPVIFVIGMPFWPYFDFGSNSSSGAPGVGKKTQCALLSKDFVVRRISLDQVLDEKSRDPTYLHAQYVKACLAEEDVDVATELAINLLGRKINEGNTWSLVLGFPERIEQLVEFEKKIQKTNFTILLKCSEEQMHQRVKNLW
ncbi:hypothetical protein F5882DRAFT_81210 [Hyaloscypha sp. PMI_1271]|nr:hypothetical protein F5882DRAFT_81210 [Hyaloscypha sp. PMI_1271]